MRCCANCEWSISPECEEEIMRENHYEENDPDRPRAGDCVLGYSHNDEYVCENHKYIENNINTYVLYDDKYWGEGYFIVTEYEKEIIKFVKLYKSTYYELPSYHIRGYEVGSLDNGNGKFREIEIKVDRREELFKIICNFASMLNGERLYTCGAPIYGKNNLSAEVYKNTAYLILAKDILKAKQPYFVDIELGDNLTYEEYEAVSTLFRELSQISAGTVKDSTMKRILKISK